MKWYIFRSYVKSPLIVQGHFSNIVRSLHFLWIFRFHSVRPKSLLSALLLYLLHKFVLSNELTWKSPYKKMANLINTLMFAIFNFKKCAKFILNCTVRFSQPILSIFLLQIPIFFWFMYSNTPIKENADHFW